jgi:TusE/DsrC/DsvC family sulfur relay protein
LNSEKTRGPKIEGGYFGMATVEYKGKTFTVDEDGFLENLDQWCDEWVDYVKESEGIKELTDEHWKVIGMLQDYYKKNGIAPMVRILSKVTGYKLKHIYELFPSGPGKGACKMAGLAKPTGCV